MDYEQAKKEIQSHRKKSRSNPEEYIGETMILHSLERLEGIESVNKLIEELNLPYKKR